VRHGRDANGAYGGNGPIRGYIGSDLPKHNPAIRSFGCPFTGETLALTPALIPNLIIIHAQKGIAVAMFSSTASPGFRKNERELTLVGLHPGVTAGQMTAQTGWPLKISDSLEMTPEPTEVELTVLRGLHERTLRAPGGQAGPD